jgi:hypothetical protein
VDVLAAFPVAALAIFLAALPENAKDPAKLRDVVNTSSKWPMPSHAAPGFHAVQAKD